MGDVPINYIEGVGGTRVAEEDIVAVGKHDVSAWLTLRPEPLLTNRCRSSHSKLVGRPLRLCTVCHKMTWVMEMPDDCLSSLIFIKPRDP